MLRLLTIMSVISVLMLAKVPAGNQMQAPSTYQLEKCFGCHQDFRNRRVLIQQKAQAIHRVRTGQMPPGIRLTDAEKTQLIRQIQESAK